jgi:hypothetical protein
MRSICVYSEAEGIYLLPGATLDGEWIRSGGELHATSKDGDLHAALVSLSRFRCPRIGELEAYIDGESRTVCAEGLRVLIPITERDA